MDEIGIGKERASDGRVFAPKNLSDFPPKINDNEETTRKQHTVSKRRLPNDVSPASRVQRETTGHIRSRDENERERIPWWC
jgi:hypothetical protein